MKTKIKWFSIIILMIAISSCNNKAPKVYMQTFYEDGYWGYNIIVNDKICIHQDYVPALIGNMRFANEKDAELVGKLVLKKMMNKETPTVDAGELRQLGIKVTS